MANDIDLLRDLIDYAESGKVAEPHMVEKLRAVLADRETRSAVSPQDERALFEAWAARVDINTARHPDRPEDYRLLSANAGWEAWQARAALPAQAVAASPHVDTDRQRFLDLLEEVLAAKRVMLDAGCRPAVFADMFAEYSRRVAPAHHVAPSDAQRTLKNAADALDAASDHLCGLPIKASIETLPDVLSQVADRVRAMLAAPLARIDAAIAGLAAAPAAPQSVPDAERVARPIGQVFGASALAAVICQRVAELPDRNSPEDWLEAMFVTGDELHQIVHDALIDAQPAAQPANAITGHDLSTSEGGRGYVAEYFATRLRRHDFSRYIAERLAADFACALARHLDGQPQRPAVASKARTQGGAAS